MPSSLTAKLSQLKFPPVCVVCMSSAVREYELEKIFTYGRRSHTVRMKVPMCDTHAEAASFKGPAEKFMGNFAIIGGILCGFFAATLLIMRWVGQVGIVAKIFGGALFGVGTFIIIWWVVTASIAPLFATPQSKEARSAVQIAMYWPKDEIVRLNIKNDRLAELIQKAN